jgi:hypothetical protein
MGVPRETTVRRQPDDAAKNEGQHGCEGQKRTGKEAGTI